MKPNRFKRVMSEGRVPVGHMIAEFGTRGMAQMLQRANVDFALIDTEHTGFSTADVADMIAWLQGTDIAPFVRVPQIEYHLLARTMDAGALGVMVPNVTSAEQARAIVDAVKYAPLGRRGVILGNANTSFKKVDPAEFLAFANENTTIICQIESQEGLDNLEGIASTPGVDVLWVGHTDLTNSLGIVGQFGHPRFLAAMELVATTAREHGLGAGGQPGNLELARQWIGMGFNVMSFSSDRAVYLDALSSGVAGMRGLASGEHPPRR
jgi:2-keto-3-deoxy-L-rhamnonate aldolase RhmA